MKKKGCELCSRPAQLHCESDGASLCWDCDATVHGANFLVAKHSRSPLCRSCESPTPWKAAGPRLHPIDSICERCMPGERPAVKTGANEGVAEEMTDVGRASGDDYEEVEDSEEEKEEYSEEDEEEDEEEGENQVVPWSDADGEDVSVTSVSRSEEEDGDELGSRDLVPRGSLKRKREGVDHHLGSSQEEIGCSPLPSPSNLISQSDGEANGAFLRRPFYLFNDQKRATFLQSYCGEHSQPFRTAI